MNQNYTEFKFPQIKAHPWNKVFRSKASPEAVDLMSKLLVYTPDRCVRVRVRVHVRVRVRVRVRVCVRACVFVCDIGMRGACVYVCCARTHTRTCHISKVSLCVCIKRLQRLTRKKPPNPFTHAHFTHTLTHAGVSHRCKRARTSFSTSCATPTHGCPMPSSRPSLISLR